MPDRLTLQGCSPTVLGSYLKALGVLRLLSSAANSVTGQPADPLVRGWWEGERFRLLASFGRVGLMRFFQHDYAPSPIIAPWNGGSGFYPMDNRDGFGPLTARVAAQRFRPLSEAIRCGEQTLHFLDLETSPKGEDKARLVAMLRSRMPDSALPWIDAALVLSGGGLRFPPLLGTGGNDGRLEFTNNFMRRLVSEKKPPGIFDAATGESTLASGRLLENALFGSPVHELTDTKIGQFAPGIAGGTNASTGYEGDPTVNPWDYVLMLEGAATFASTAARRHRSRTASRTSFPFTTEASGAGWGGVEAADESEARGEFWAPLWSRPARFLEIQALFGEGRAVVNGRTARDGVEFARALANLGVSRGLSEFQRFGFFQRAGRSYYAAALGRRRAAPSPGAQLVADLERGGWLRKVRWFGRDDKRYQEGAEYRDRVKTQKRQPVAVRSALKRLEDSLFGLLAPECPPRSVRAALRAVGGLGRWLSNSPKGQEDIVPPPLLSRRWLVRADDGTAEYRIAAALAAIGFPPRSDSGVPGSSEAPSHDSSRSRPPPMAAHFAPLTNGPRDGFENRTFFSGPGPGRVRSWANDHSPPTVTWGHGGLVANMVAVLERRLVETPIRGLADKPLDSATPARLADVAAFLSEGFDDARCSELLAGMVWAQPALLRAPEADAGSRRATAPFAYSALKPLFSTTGALVRTGAIPKDGSMPIPPGLLGQLRGSGGSRDGRGVDRAVRLAFARARSSDLPSLYDSVQASSGIAALHSGRIGIGLCPDRLAAALLIPISDRGLASLLRRAYPGSISDSEPNSSEETPNAD